MTRRLQLSGEGSSTDSTVGKGGAAVEASPKLKLAEKSSKKGSSNKDSYGGSILSVSTSEDGFETVTMSPDARGMCVMQGI